MEKKESDCGGGAAADTTKPKISANGPILSGSRSVVYVLFIDMCCAFFWYGSSVSFPCFCFLFSVFFRRLEYTFELGGYNDVSALKEYADANEVQRGSVVVVLLQSCFRFSFVCSPKIYSSVFG